MQGSGLGPFLFLIYILDLRRLSSLNNMCKYADNVFKLCSQRSSVALEEEYAHIQEFAQVNNLSINISKTKQIVFYKAIPYKL